VSVVLVQPVCNEVQSLTHKQTPLPLLLVVVEKRGVCGNNYN